MPNVVNGGNAAYMAGMCMSLPIGVLLWRNDMSNPLSLDKLDYSNLTREEAVEQLRQIANHRPSIIPLIHWIIESIEYRTMKEDIKNVLSLSENRANLWKL